MRAVCHAYVRIRMRCAVRSHMRIALVARCCASGRVYMVCTMFYVLAAPREGYAVPRSRTTDARKQLQNSVITSVFSVFNPVFDTKHVFCIINICATNVTLSYDCAQLPRVFGSNRCFRMDACGCYYAICRHQRIGGWMMKMLRRGGGLSSSQTHHRMLQACRCKGCAKVSSDGCDALARRGWAMPLARPTTCGISFRRER